MTKPAQYHHNRIAGKPALSACKNAQRTPHGNVVFPSRLILSLFHNPSPNGRIIPQPVGYVNGI